MSRRSRAREVVIQVLYEDDLNPDRSPEIADQFLCSRLNADQDLIDFARSLLAGVRKHREQSIARPGWGLCGHGSFP